MSTVTATQLYYDDVSDGTPAGAGEVHNTSRFGAVEVAPDSVLEFPDGLIGLGGSRYALLSTDPDSPFMWMQSLEDPSVALPVVNPHRFFDDFAVELSDDDASRLGLDQGAAADVLVTVTAGSELAQFTANLRAPILVSAGVAHQVINQAAGAQVKAPLFPQAAGS